MPPVTLFGNLPRDLPGRYFTGPWDPSSDAGMAWRAVNVSGGLAAGQVALVDANGHALVYDTAGRLTVVPPAAVTATAVNAGASVTGDQAAAVTAATGLRLFGYSVMEDAAAPAGAALRIMHGATVGGGVQVEVISLTAGESTADYWGPDGVDCPNGISIDWISGSFKLSLKTKVVG